VVHAVISGIFSEAIDLGYTEQNPARTVKLFRKTQKRERFLSQEEMSQLLNHLPYHQKPMIQFALLTGLRRANLLNLKWGQVDIEHGNLIIPAEEIKGGRDLKLPLSPEAIELLDGLPRRSDYVFCKEDGKPYQDIYSGFRLACKKAGLEDCTIHTLRHTVGSHLVMSGVDLSTVKELLGHRDIQTTLRYAHLSQIHIREAIKKVGKLGGMDTYMDTKEEENE
jgi:integrase